MKNIRIFALPLKHKPVRDALHKSAEHIIQINKKVFDSLAKR